MEAKKRFFASLPLLRRAARDCSNLDLESYWSSLTLCCRDSNIPYFATCGTLLGRRATVVLFLGMTTSILG